MKLRKGQYGLQVYLNEKWEWVFAFMDKDQRFHEGIATTQVPSLALPKDAYDYATSKRQLPFRIWKVGENA